MKLKAKELDIRTVLQLTVLLHQVFVAAQGIFPSCGEWATLCHGARTSQGGDFSCCRAQALESVGLSSCGTWARQLWYTCLVAPWHVDSSRPRIESVSPALVGEFLPTVPPGKFSIDHFETILGIYKDWTVMEMDGTRQELGFPQSE